jgi:hypothetical protein
MATILLRYIIIVKRRRRRNRALCCVLLQKGNSTTTTFNSSPFPSLYVTAMKKAIAKIKHGGAYKNGFKKLSIANFF